MQTINNLLIPTHPHGHIFKAVSVLLLITVYILLSFDKFLQFCSANFFQNRTRRLGTLAI